jgi:hypothetical protein
MKGVFTLGIYIAIGITDAAFGQTRVTTTAERITTAERLGPVAPMSAGMTFSSHSRMNRTKPIDHPAARSGGADMGQGRADH